MDSLSFSIKPIPKKLAVLIFAITLFFVGSVFSDSEKSSSQITLLSKSEVMRGVAQNWIQVGLEQYERGLFEASGKSFLRAKDSEQYLAGDERKKLAKHLQKAGAIIRQRKETLQQIQVALSLLEKGQLIEAMTHLRRAESGKYLQHQERKEVMEAIESIQSKLKKQKRNISKIEKTVNNAQNIQTFKSASGESRLIKVNKELIEIYIPKPEEKISAKTSLQSKAKELVVIEVADPVEDEKSNITDNGLNSRERLLRSYARAVVKEAVTKAGTLTAQGRYFKAKAAVEDARQKISKNRSLLRANLLKQYDSELKELSDRIATERKNWLGN